MRGGATSLLHPFGFFESLRKNLIYISILIYILERVLVGILSMCVFRSIHTTS